MCCPVCLCRRFCDFCYFFISGCSIYLTMLFLSQNHVVISQGIVCLLIRTRCRQLSDKTWGWNFVSSAARRCYVYFRFFSSWLFPLRRLLQRFDLCYSVTFRGCRNITQVFWKILLLHKTGQQSPLHQGVCGDFLEGACDLSENNILDHNRYTDTPTECQVMLLSTE